LQRKFEDKMKWMTKSAEQGYEPAIIWWWGDALVI
jgi:hypothetical protein